MVQVGLVVQCLGVIPVNQMVGPQACSASVELTKSPDSTEFEYG